MSAAKGFMSAAKGFMSAAVIKIDDEIFPGLDMNKLKTLLH